MAARATYPMLARPKRATVPAMRAFHHLALQVKDLPAMERFYRELLELPVLQRWPDGQGGERSVWLSLEDGFIALERAPAELAVPERGDFADGRVGYYVLALRIAKAEREAWEKRLAQARVTVERRTAYSLFFRDPEGNRLAVSHHPEAAQTGA
jgi:catechol 2,3-dioxygenase-like lactoylglutathione lyase family enzyme